MSYIDESLVSFVPFEEERKLSTFVPHKKKENFLCFGNSSSGKRASLYMQSPSEELTSSFDMSRFQFDRPINKMSLRSSGRRGSTFQEREEARKKAVMTFQPKKGRIIHYFKDRYPNETVLSSAHTREQTQENEEHGKRDSIIEHDQEKSFSSESEKSDSSEGSEEKKVKIVYNLGDVFSFKTAKEDILKKYIEGYGFDIHEMQRNRITHDKKYAIVTILYEKGVEHLLPSVRKELNLTIMPTSSIVVEKEIDESLDIDGYFKSKIIDDSTLVIYWINDVSDSKRIEENVELLNSFRPDTPLSEYFWELVLFSPKNVQSRPNDIDIKKFNVTHSDCIRGERYKFFGNNELEFKTFTTEELKDKFKDFYM